MVGTVDLPRKKLRLLLPQWDFYKNDYSTTQTPCQAFFSICLRKVKGFHRHIRFCNEYTKVTTNRSTTIPYCAQRQVGKTMQLQARQGKRGFPAGHVHRRTRARRTETQRRNAPHIQRFTLRREGLRYDKRSARRHVLPTRQSSFQTLLLYLREVRFCFGES